MATLLRVKIDETDGVQTGTANDFGLFGSISIPTPLNAALADPALGVSPTGVVAALSGVSASTPSGDPVPLSTANLLDMGFRASAYAGGLDSGLTTTSGRKIFLFSYASDNNVLVGRVGTAGGAADSAGQVAFLLYLDSLGTGSDTTSDAGATSVQMWLLQFVPLSHPDANNPNDEVTIDPSKLVVDVNSLLEFDATNAPSGQNVFLMIGDGTPAASEITLVVTSTDPLAQSGGGVNSSQGGGGMTLGVGSQQVTTGSGLYISFVTGADPNFVVPNLTATEAASAANIQFGSFYGATAATEVKSAQFDIAQMAPSGAGATVLVKAIANTDAAEIGAAYVAGLGDADDGTIAITKVTITRTAVSGNKTEVKALSFTADATNASFGFTILKGNNPPEGSVSVDFDSNGVLTIIGARADDHIVYETASGHNRVLIQNVGNANVADLNGRFDVGDFTLNSGNITPLAIDAVAFVDDAPLANGTAQTGDVDEDGLTGGIAGGTGDQVFNADGDNNEAVALGSVAAIFTPGRDGLGGYSLATDTSGLVQTLTSAGAAVKYDVTGNTLTAYVDSGSTIGALDATDRRIFNFALNGTTGAFTFTLQDQLDHPTTSTEADERDVDLSTILQVSDGDGDKATATAGQMVISVFDDSPNPLAPGDITVNNLANATANATLGYTGKVGADEPGTVQFVGTNGSQLQGTVQDGTPTLSNLLLDGAPIYLFGFGTATLVATTDSTNTSASARVFQMTLSATNNLYDITMFKTLTNVEDVEFGDFVAKVASGNPDQIMVSNIGGSPIDALFSGFVDQSNATSAVTTVNVSQAGVGVGVGQDFDFDPQTASATDNLSDRIMIQFLQDTGNETLEIGEAQNINRFTFVMNQNNSPADDGDLVVRAYDPGTLAAASDDVEDQITGILINGTALVSVVNGVVTIGAGVASNDGGTVTAVASGKGFELHGLGGGTAGNKNDNDTVTIITASGYQRLDITGIGNDANKDTFDILLKSVGIPTRFDIDFSVQANLVDQDGDPSAAQNLDVELVGVAPA